MVPANPILLEGRLDVWNGGFDLREILLSVCHTEESGLLAIDNGKFQKKIFVQDGRVVFASSSSPDDRLGVYLMLRNEFALADLRRLSPQVRPGLRLGTLLVRDGILAPDRLIHVVFRQVRAIILSLCRWSQASYCFEEELPSKDEKCAASYGFAALWAGYRFRRRESGPKNPSTRTWTRISRVSE
jgi:hypothetical protein